MIINIMTATLAPGDAIGNYILTLRRILADMGFHVRLYADSVVGIYKVLGIPSVHYRPSGDDVLWFHYSIFTDGMSWIERSTDFKIMDFHGVSPPRLFEGYNSQLESLCRLGEITLPKVVNEFDLCIVHSDYSRDVLHQAGCTQPIEKLPLVVDLHRFTGAEDRELSRLLQQVEYLLFVGRIVPQKGILDALRVLQHLKQRRPNIKLFLVGNYEFSSRYVGQIRNMIQDLGLEEDVMLTGPISEAASLTSFYTHAALSLYLSEWESFCVPVIESTYFGTPVVANSVGPLPETVGGAGILVNKEDPQSVAQSIDELLRDPLRYQEMQAQGRVHAQRYTELALKESVASLLRQVDLL